MKTSLRRIGALLILALLLATAAVGCEESTDDSAKAQVSKRAKKFQPYLPKHDVELSNYNRAQRLYDSPSTIIWCSTTWGNASAPIVTVPVAGKLTSSSTTFFRPEEGIEIPGSDNGGVGTARSVDGLFHPNPPGYRYAFTPGGQYVDFFNMPTFCSTALTKFQRQETRVAVEYDQIAKVADRQAEAALRRGDRAGAERILSGAVGQ